MKMDELLKPSDIWLVAITGRSGAGKSAVREYYKSLGYPTADGDAIAREITEPGAACLIELKAEFGSDILHEDGTLNRTILGRTVFENEAKNRKLIDITHPHIAEKTFDLARKAQENGHSLFFVDGAMIVGLPFAEVCDKIIVVTAERALSISRIILRDGISKHMANNRLSAQKTEQELCAAADYVIENNSTQKALCEQADAVLKALLNKRMQ